jgi:flagellar motor protein MotB
MANTPPIIIKRKAAHGGEHGGAWKVAYADFVTAMMALFIVLWLLNSSKQVQEAVGGYLKDPTGTSKMVGSRMAGSGDSFSLSMADRANAARRLRQLSGVGPAQVTQVRGYADQRLRKPESPEDASNRRISVIVQYQVKPAAEPDPPPNKATPAHWPGARNRSPPRGI